MSAKSRIGKSRVFANEILVEKSRKLHMRLRDLYDAKIGDDKV